MRSDIIEVTEINQQAIGGSRREPGKRREPPFF
jgi:hypothetical protein